MAFWFGSEEDDARCGQAMAGLWWGRSAETDQTIRDRFGVLHNRLANGAHLDYAKQHADVIGRFGRYPHRNVALGRQSTPEEAEYLQQPGAVFRVISVRMVLN